MSSDKIVELLRIFDRQQEVIRVQDEIIEGLTRLVALHVSSEELEDLDVVAKIRALAIMRAEI